MSREIFAWNYEGKPEPGKDCRKLVTLQDDSMVWVGIRAWHSDSGRWFNGNEPERGVVLAWADLPDPAIKRWIHGELT